MFLKFRMFALLALMMSFFSAGLAWPAPKPAQLILAIGGESAEGYDPIKGWGRYGHPLFQSTLLTRDENFNLTGDLATEYKLSENRLIWRIKIREDVKFSDGHPLSAEDVAFTFSQAAASGSVVDLTNLERAEVVGPHEVAIHLKKPEITFSDYLIKLGIVPKHAYGPGYARRPVGSGPYKMVEWNEGQRLIVEHNHFYYGPAPAFKRLVFLFLESDAAFASAKAGQVQVVAVPQALARQKIKNMKLHPVKSVDNRGIMFPMLPQTGAKSTTGFAIGHNVTADVSLRRAVNFALNRQALVDGVLYGYGEPAYGLADGLPWDEPRIRFQDNDLEKAGKILLEGGWADTDGDGVLEKNGLKASFKLAYPASDPTRQNLALAIRDQLRPAGIQVEPLGTTWDNIYTQYSFNTPILYGWGDTSPLEMYQIYHSRAYDDAPDSSSLNPGRYHNPEVDRHLDEAQSAPSFEASLSHWRKAQWDGQTGPAVHGDAAWAWLVNLTHTYFISEDLDLGQSAIEPHGHGWPITANITKWRWLGQ